MKDDLLEPQPNGTVKMSLAGVAFTLRRPKIKEFRVIRETLVALGTDSIDDAASAATSVKKGKLPVNLTTDVDREDKLLDWWRLVFDTLSDNPDDLPENDELPLWLFDAEVIPQLLQVWLKSPQVLGASKDVTEG